MVGGTPVSLIGAGRVPMSEFNIVVAVPLALGYMIVGAATGVALSSVKVAIALPGCALLFLLVFAALARDSPLTKPAHPTHGLGLPVVALVTSLLGIPVIGIVLGHVSRQLIKTQG